MNDLNQRKWGKAFGLLVGMSRISRQPDIQPQNIEFSGIPVLFWKICHQEFRIPDLTRNPEQNYHKDMITG